MLANLPDGVHFAQAVGHSLCYPAVDSQPLGQMTGVERFRQPAGCQLPQVAGSPEGVRVAHPDQQLVFALQVSLAPTPPSAMPRVAILFDLYQQHLQREPAVWKHIGKVNQVVKDVQQLATLRAAPSGDDLTAPRLALYKQLANHNRFDNTDAVVSQQYADFVADGPQAAMLYFHQLSIHNRVDAVSAKSHFGFATFTGVEAFELLVE